MAVVMYNLLLNSLLVSVCVDKNVSCLNANSFHCAICTIVYREAWKVLDQMSTEEAMKNYINELTRINGNWEQCMGITQTINEVNIPALCHGTVRFGFTQFLGFT